MPGDPAGPRPSLPHVPGVRMTGANQTPSNYITDSKYGTKYDVGGETLKTAAIMTLLEPCTT